MTGRTFSLRLLQVYSVLSATVAVVGGGTFVLGGVDGVARIVGTEYAALVPMLEQASTTLDPAARTTFSTWYRALGWYWLMTGVMLFWITPSVQFRTVWFRFIHVAFMAVGVASLVTIAESGTNVHNRYGAVVFEIGIPCAAMLWQSFVARRAMPATALKIRGVYLFVDDLAKTTAFYELLGFDVEVVSDMFARAFCANGLVLEFGTSRLTRSYDPDWEAAGHPSTNTIGIELPSSEAVDEAYERMIGAGYAGHLAPCDPPWQARFALIDDPDGNIVGLHGPRTPEAGRIHE